MRICTHTHPLTYTHTHAHNKIEAAYGLSSGGVDDVLNWGGCKRYLCKCLCVCVCVYTCECIHVECKRRLKKKGIKVLWDRPAIETG